VDKNIGITPDWGGKVSINIEAQGEVSPFFRRDIFYNKVSGSF